MNAKILLTECKVRNETYFPKYLRHWNVRDKKRIAHSQSREVNTLFSGPQALSNQSACAIYDLKISSAI